MNSERATSASPTSMTELLAAMGDPLTYHPDSPRDATSTSGEKKACLAALIALGTGLSPADQNLIRVAATCALLAHCNHFRGGAGNPVALSHLFEVAHRTKEALRDLELQNFGPAYCSPVAIGVAAAILHDAIEDFPCSIRRFSVAPADAASWISRHVFDELSAQCGIKNSGAVLDRVKLLTLPNTDEVPTCSYLENISADPIAAAVKRSDIEHNFSTFASYSTVYPVLMAGAQYIHYPAIYSAETARSLRELLSLLRADEVCPWRPGESTAAVVIEALHKHEGSHGIDRAYQFIASALKDTHLSSQRELLKLQEELGAARDTTVPHQRK